MIRSRAPAGVLAIVAWFTLAALFMRVVHAQETGTAGRQPGATAHFDLPAQPLAKALQDFARITELIVLAPAPLLDGRTSAPVRGEFLPRDALERVLAGTGLRAEFARPDEAIIVARPAADTATVAAPADSALPIDGVGASDELRTFAGLLQTHLIDALCAQPAAVPGSYRLVAQVRIDNKGAVVAVNMVASSGLASRDAAVLRALRTLKLDAAPPAALPQPVTILLRPVGSGVHFRCPRTAERN
ncbi:secretin and TonB N-terminal domain-containing protein [Burkholderia ubonensis]|uniref:secretin and TonB N-terminal domain-containing protein n=1 Tax=Burkholderia ubonensis TaxID=101571 RepID=UPI00075DEFE4|nr:secretin and TonB N-terminal domain-containing protein [Burkholderia ubonensis]KVS40541.1 secretin and TonB N terminus short domain protein [Burkholderia ubonensis]KVS51157.1 secretin and TonB N terminus short domain protein [Burkholderia ubonensis]KVS76162.1 secretin and TonB N terminus short domain protein [Burkholderia ubonensis]KVS78400.1 secretin and TonB N terminus short domain protein [Burkholderia ubonensis]KVS82304.1 secretin and TonB N terminus short domain protein [Burkholderia u